MPISHLTLTYMQSFCKDHSPIHCHLCYCTSKAALHRLSQLQLNKSELLISVFQVFATQKRQNPIWIKTLSATDICSASHGMPTVYPLYPPQNLPLTQDFPTGI